MAPDADIEKAETESLFKDLPGADEDYEEDMYGVEGNESYAANENEVQEDNEDWIQGAVKDMKEKGTEGALTRAAKAAGEVNE